MGEPFHTILGVPLSEEDAEAQAWAEEQRPPRTEAEIAASRQAGVLRIVERLGDELSRASEWACEYEVETVEVEPEGDYKRFEVTPRMRMVIEWVKPEAVSA